ncbi:hypothetical protein E4U42_007758 [Claviceps africana]|uniref:Postreplication repair E3 ubiquitin-protein ligase RAD18 n=1 Tax=Claviceps africana TaxID=83212 RepID=A0A8K0JAU4_9HYPO|nr:hypothetical protein E4U42_007758 [Claviceps africana]
MDNVPDSTDWLETPLACMAAVDAALRCQVCKDFFQTPMITSCSHTFCSLCIRRALSSDGKCPLCRSSEQELKLRCNWAMAETVEAFSRARTPALTLARTSHGSSSPSKRKAEHDGHELSASEGQKRRRTSARLSGRKKIDDGDESLRGSQQGETLAAASEEDVHSEDRNGESRPSHVDDFVPCPSCQKHMKAWQVFQHLEACPGPNAESGSSNSLTSLQQQQQQQQQQVRQPKFVERLPALNYSILKEQALRKKLAELGISNQGPRVLLEKRHKEWINLWNANCDAASPKKRSQLLQDLDVWEKTQGYRSPAAGPTTLNVTMIKDKNFDGARWAAKHDSSFKDLIASARKNVVRTNALAKNEDQGRGGVEDEAGKQTNGQQPMQNAVAHHQEPLDHVKSANDACLNLQQDA